MFKQSPSKAMHVAKLVKRTWKNGFPHFERIFNVIQDLLGIYGPKILLPVQLGFTG